MRETIPWDIHFISLSMLTAKNKSKDPRTQVGCCITTEDNRSISLGFNGFPAGLLENDTLWSREHKYSRVIHSELNCLLNCPFDTKGCILYCTHIPCQNCMGHIINAGIKKVIYYDYDPKYEDKNYPWIDRVSWNEYAELLEVIAIPKNDYLEILR